MFEGSDVPTDECFYRARDGRYYNGYMGSADFLEDLKPMFDEMYRKIEAQINADLANQKLDDAAKDRDSEGAE